MFVILEILKTYVDVPFFCPFGKNVSSSCAGAAPFDSLEICKQNKNLKFLIYLEFENW